MTLNEMLERVLDGKVLETPNNDDSIILREPDKNSNMKVEVAVQSAPVTAIRLRKFSHFSALRDGSWKQLCDYLLIVKSDDGMYAVFIEMKKTFTEEEKPREQLRRSPPFLEYLLSVCKIEDSSIERRLLTTKYVIIAEKSGEKIDKQSVKIKPSRMTEKEQYKGIDIKSFITPRLTLAALTSE